jgi:uncharacterized membrane protein
MSDQQFTAPEITSDDKLWGLLCYLLNPVVPIIALLMEDKKARPFVRFHAIQALGWVVVWFVASIVVVGVCLSPLALVGSIYFAVKAYQGEYIEIPGLTTFMRNQGWL